MTYHSSILPLSINNIPKEKLSSNLGYNIACVGFFSGWYTVPGVPGVSGNALNYRKYISASGHYLDLTTDITGIPGSPLMTSDLIQYPVINVDIYDSLF